MWLMPDIGSNHVVVDENEVSVFKLRKIIYSVNEKSRRVGRKKNIAQPRKMTELKSRGQGWGIASSDPDSPFVRIFALSELNGLQLIVQPL